MCVGLKDHKNLAIQSLSAIKIHMRFPQDRFVVGHEGRPETVLAVKAWWYWVREGKAAAEYTVVVLDPHFSLQIYFLHLASKWEHPFF